MWCEDQKAPCTANGASFSWKQTNEKKKKVKKYQRANAFVDEWER